MDAVRAQPLNRPIQPALAQPVVTKGHPSAVVPDAAGMLGADDDAVGWRGAADEPRRCRVPAIAFTEIERTAPIRKPDAVEADAAEDGKRRLAEDAAGGPRQQPRRGQADRGPGREEKSQVPPRIENIPEEIAGDRRHADQREKGAAGGRQRLLQDPGRNEERQYAGEGQRRLTLDEPPAVAA